MSNTPFSEADKSFFDRLFGPQLPAPPASVLWRDIGAAEGLKQVYWSCPGTQLTEERFSRLVDHIARRAVKAIIEQCPCDWQDNCTCPQGWLVENTKYPQEVFFAVFVRGD